VEFFDHTFLTPEHNLACDEALLDLCEEENADEILRFWEPRQYFVVLGSSNKVEEEVFVERCNAGNIPILRRHSGGGTVLQGAGCLNYSLILKIKPDEPTRNITDTTHYIMQRHADLLSNLTGEKVEMKGSSDLAVNGRKFSGNAQRRKLQALLFHGTFLLNFDLDLIEKYLKMPPKQPEYRGRRSHVEFVRNVAIDSSLIKEELKRVWNTTEEFSKIPHERMEKLVQTKYARAEWNFKL
jgi:lipoate-protein ligase A